MRPQTATAPDTSPDHAPACDGEGARVERNLAVLDQLREAALRVALAIEQACVAAAAPAAVDDDGLAGCVEGDDPALEAPAKPSPASPRTVAELALAFHRASRAVRMTVALQDRLIKEAKAPVGAGAPEQTHLRVTFVDPTNPESVADLNARYAASLGYPAPAPMASKAEVESVVRRVAETGLQRGELGPREAAEAVERLVREAAERLEEEDEFEALMRRPVSEIVERICRDLDLAPDWPRLAEEAWARREIESGRAGAPLRPFRPAPAPPPPGHPGAGRDSARPTRPAERRPDTASP